MDLSDKPLIVLNKSSNAYSKMFKPIKFFSLFFLMNLFLSAQVTENIKSDIKHFGNSGKNLWNSFTQFEANTNIKIAASLLLIGSAYIVDDEVKNFSQNNRSKFADNLFKIDDYYGDPLTLIAIGTFYGIGLIGGNENLRTTALTAAEAAFYSGVVTSVIKSSIGRSRPYVNKGKSEFNPIKFNAAETAFPSGHTTITFAISTALAEQTNSSTVKIVLYSAATLVGAARIYNNAHWFSDVVGGGLIGYFIGKHVGENQSNNNIHIFPTTNNVINILIPLN